MPGPPCSSVASAPCALAPALIFLQLDLLSFLQAAGLASCHPFLIPCRCLWWLFPHSSVIMNWCPNAHFISRISSSGSHESSTWIGNHCRLASPMSISTGHAPVSIHGMKAESLGKFLHSATCSCINELGYMRSQVVFLGFSLYTIHFAGKNSEAAMGTLGRDHYSFSLGVRVKGYTGAHT